ncbi:hypothetical protein GCM10007860_06990 [Chitiniphilus shinanonensis]|uniref:Uncharacterized protein n=1 Tax=Chitiniphilus shinanonensis TaxID=553088 RepID=A0ABQ6BPI5_9NEIS|nr:hypothetical protein GCM10007860_06990 [Chitiniphilus shinanonensis]
MRMALGRGGGGKKAGILTPAYFLGNRRAQRMGPGGLRGAADSAGEEGGAARVATPREGGGRAGPPFDRRDPRRVRGDGRGRFAQAGPVHVQRLGPS